MIEGGCRCGAVRYEAKGQAAHHALCHCRDCQMASGSPVTAWLAMPSDGFRIAKGEPVRYTAPSGSMRAFCGTCGTPLFFINEAVLPGIVDIQSVTLDQPDVIAPQAQIQVAERRPYMADLASLSAFERFPGGN
ncbi:MAG: GFA family protein [Alteraurantiacibacter sp.]